MMNRIEQRLRALELAVFDKATHVCPVCHDGHLTLEHGDRDRCRKCGANIELMGNALIAGQTYCACEYEVKHG